jgi:membrane-bound lytic murein transglycosylase D
VYEVIDLDTEKTSVTTKIKQYRALLRSIARKEKQNQLARLTPAEVRVHQLFDTVTEDDKFNKAAARKMRAQSGQYEKFLQALQRSGMYQEHFMRIFQKHGLPIELIWLPFVESYFSYNAYSSAQAAGVWQFIPSTARMYGLHMSSAADERYDPFKAAEAAARLLKENYELLGTWPLAITAYNHGTGGMLRAVRQLDTTDFGKIALNYRSNSFGFYSRNYYAEFVAVVQLMRENRENFQALDSLPAVAYEEVRLEQRMYVNDITTRLSISTEQLAELNRDLKRTALQSKTPIPKQFRLKLPQGKKQEFITYFQTDVERP